MRKALSIGVLSMCLVAAASAASAAEIHGTLSEGGKPVPKGVNLKLVCGDVSANAATDEFGAYSLKTPTTPTGDCNLSVSYKGSTPSLKVVVYERPSRYDLEVREESGKLTLARK
jgi:hypothetical protein